MYQIEHGDRLSMLSIGDSVLVFLDGIASSLLDTICIPISTIDLQKGVLKCGLINWIFEFKKFEVRKGFSSILFNFQLLKIV